jgi:hypothetical protein
MQTATAAQLQLRVRVRIASIVGPAAGPTAHSLQPAASLQPQPQDGSTACCLALLSTGRWWLVGALVAGGRWARPRCAAAVPCRRPRWFGPVLSLSQNPRGWPRDSACCLNGVTACCRKGTAKQETRVPAVLPSSHFRSPLERTHTEPSGSSDPSRHRT